MMFADMFHILGVERSGVAMVWEMTCTLLALMEPTFGQVRNFSGFVTFIEEKVSKMIILLLL